MTQYTELLEDSPPARDRPYDRERTAAQRRKRGRRDEVDSSEIGQQLTEIVAYGTAVVARPAG